MKKRELKRRNSLYKRKIKASVNLEEMLSLKLKTKWKQVDANSTNALMKIRCGLREA